MRQNFDQKIDRIQRNIDQIQRTISPSPPKRTVKYEVQNKVNVEYSQKNERGKRLFPKSRIKDKIGKVMPKQYSVLTKNYAKKLLHDGTLSKCKQCDQQA